MENHFNSEQSIPSTINSSETNVASEATFCSNTTADHSESSVEIANKATMGKCLSICKEPKNPFFGKSESLAVAPISSPDRNDPPRLLATTSGTLANSDTTVRNNGGIHAPTDDTKHAGHLGLTLIAFPAVNHREENRDKHLLKAEANNAQEPKRREQGQQGYASSVAPQSENVNRKIEDPRQQNRDTPSGDATENTPSEGRLFDEETFPLQSTPFNSRSSNSDSHNVEIHDNQHNAQSTTPAQPECLREKGGNRDMRNEEDDVNEAAKTVPAEKEKRPVKPDISSRWIGLCCVLERKESFSDCSVPEPVQETSMKCRRLHRLMDNSSSQLHDNCVVTRLQNVTEIDILCPGVLDGPPMQLITIPSKMTSLKSFTQISLPDIQVLRLPRLQPGKSFDIDSFLYDVAQHSSGLKELVFEDAGQISKRSANSLFDINNLKRLEAYDPKVPLLRALLIGCSELEEVCFHGLTPEVERDLCMYLRQRGASLKSLCLNFSYSARTGYTTGQKEFFGRMLAFLDCAIPDELSDLHTLEISSCASYEVKHSFSAPGTSCTGTAGWRLNQVDALIRKSRRAHHAKQPVISVEEIKLRGHSTAIIDSLAALSWVNQDSMEIEVELPGVCAIYPRGFGIMKPVVLTFLQVDEFISERSHSQWLELTALRELDVGNEAFVQKYNDDVPPIRAATRRLFVTSRTSLSTIRACYKLPTRDVCMEMRKMLGQMVPLTPAVTQLDISRDIVLHASVEDYDYVQTLMLLRRWNLKTLRLVCSSNYGTICMATANDGDMHEDATEEFVKRVPAFLAILATACPKLERLVLEGEEMSAGWKICPKQALVDGALKALEVYEAVVTSVDAVTLRGELGALESE